MSDREQWGPWVAHDGNGYPAGIKGQVVRTVEECVVRGVYETPTPILVMGKWEDGGSWNWANFPACTKVLRYRIKRPRALIELREMIETLPAPSPKEDAHV